MLPADKESELNMTKIEQVRGLLGIMQTAELAVAVANAQEIQAIKQAAKVSYERLGLDADEVQEVADLANTPADFQDNAQTTDPLAVAEKPVKAKKAKALELIAEAKRAGASRKDTVENLMTVMAITNANAAYYYDRVYQG